MRSIRRGLLRVGVVLVLACIGMWTFRIELRGLFCPAPIPTLTVERDGENIVLSAYPDISETHAGVNRALKEAGIPCDVVCLVRIGNTRAAVLSMHDWSFWEKRWKDPRFCGGEDARPLLLVPVHAILEAFEVVGQPTNAITSRIIDLRTTPLVQPKNAGQQK